MDHLPATRAFNGHVLDAVRRGRSANHVTELGDGRIIAIVRAVIGLGRGLDLPVVAEGIETNDQLSFLPQESCNEVQGYFIGRPASIDQYANVVGRTPSTSKKRAQER
jgi:EAL domain-containing protein (putative c-di-GMP-specific phosphodiesterase class I)